MNDMMQFLHCEKLTVLLQKNKDFNFLLILKIVILTYIFLLLENKK